MTTVSIDLAVPAVPAATTASRPPLTEDAVRRIIAIDDPALRNLWITESYADLAGRLLAIFETDQSWCTFATWASNTAGASIRGDELPRLVNSVLPDVAPHVCTIVDAANDRHGVLRRLGLAVVLERTGVETLIATALREVADFIAHGNTLVYAELAPIFVRLVEWLEHVDRDADIGERLRSIGVPDASDDPLVHLAFRSYAEAAFATDERVRAQLVLTANVAAVLHEQQRLQGDISQALDAGLLDLEAELADLCHRWLPDGVRRAVGRRTHGHVGPHVEQLWERVATHVMMTLPVPGETLHLGRDLPPLADGEYFADALRSIDHPALERLLGDWDPTNGTTIGSGADDWADLHQRMGFIVNLFRSRQRHLPLTVSPFDAAQFAAMQDRLAMADGTVW